MWFVRLLDEFLLRIELNDELSKLKICYFWLPSYQGARNNKNLAEAHSNRFHSIYFLKLLFDFPIMSTH